MCLDNIEMRDFVKKEEIRENYRLKFAKKINEC